MYRKGEMYSVALLIASTSLVLAGRYDLNPKDNKAVEKETQAEENPMLFEGDIVMSKREVDKLIQPDDNDLLGKRESLTDRRKHWPNGIMPYVISSSIDSRGRGAIQAAIQHYKKYTCIKLVPRTNQQDFVRFIKGRGCFSTIGKKGGMQDISIGEGCQYTGTAIHEIMHALGFYHEQSRLDRDNYITIYWNNIISGMEYNFNKYKQGVAENLGEKYDTGSVMHYPEYAFSKNRLPTIRAKDGSKIGQRQDLSPSDKRHINKMYCSGKGGVTPASGCEDKDSRCPGWAKNFCESPTYKTWMANNCCKSCKEQACTDKNSGCAGWADKHCNNPQYKSWMQNNCCKSCTEKVDQCKDKYSNCACMVKGNLNMCKMANFKAWMQNNCCASCKNR